MRSHGSRSSFSSSRSSSSRSASRSHFGGGSSSRSHSRPSHSTVVRHRVGMHPARSRSSVHVHVGGSGYGYHHSTYYEGHRASLSAVLTIIGIILGFVAIAFGAMIFSDISMKKTIVNDYNYYQNVIENAQTNPLYKQEAIVTDKLYADNDRWAIEYRLNDHYNESFAVYSYEEVNEFTIGQKIQVAVVSPNSSQTDSIPMDYYGMPIENDTEYINYQKSIRLHVIITTVLVAGAVLLIVLAIKSHKKEKGEASLESSTNTPSQSKPNVCSYCGGKLSGTDTSCPNCGASNN